ncbi:hypothetical protein [Pseudodesulfovibrio pelocollis]|uniref:hypothetical protein n=1 Tax=Pseudodesulfovibrio pelocollis TaxID=3051432 RepID=UPI00255AC08E|nr:hypothetical protein [Pseudodesulfovibrio sp. SB368]
MTRYTDAQYEDAYPDGIESHYWHSARNRILLDQLDTIRFSGVGLDVGCGRGMDVMKFREAGYDYHGVEVGNPAPYLPAGGQYLHLNRSSFDLPQDFREQVTLLSFLDVLPCIKDMSVFLQAHYAHFPNVRYVLAWMVARQEIFSNYDVHVGTLKRYTLNEVRALFPIGTILNAQYCFRLLYPPARMLSLLGIPRNTKIHPPANDSLATRTAHALLSRYFVLESEILPKNLWGTSIVCLVEL